MPSTGLSGSQVLDVCEQVVALAAGHPPAAGSRALGLYQCVKLVLLALRHNLTQELLAELLDVSQPTVSRVISTYTPLLARALEANVPTVEDLAPPRHHPGHRRHRPGLLGLEGPPRAVLRRVPQDRPQRPGRLHAVRVPGVGVRPPARKRP